MRRVRSFSVAVLALLLSSGAGAVDTAKVTLTIKGMTCGGCVAAVKLQLRKTEGVSAYDVSFEKGEAEVTYDSAKTDPKRIAESVSTTGFQASVKREEKKGASPTDNSIRPWAINLVYDRRVRWKGIDPPAPTFWMHQLEEDVGADQKLCLAPKRSSLEVVRRVERKG